MPEKLTVRNSFIPTLYQNAWGAITLPPISFIGFILWYVYSSSRWANVVLGIAITLLVIGIFWLVLIYRFRKQLIAGDLLQPEQTFFAELFYGTPEQNFIPKEISRNEIKPIEKEKIEKSAIKQPAIKALQAATVQPQDPQLARIEFNAESVKALRSIHINVKLNRVYSIQELRHFRVLFEIINEEIADFWLGCQDAYNRNEYAMDGTNMQFGMKYTLRYRDDNNNFVPAPLFTGENKYIPVTDCYSSVDKIKFSISLYQQIPAYNILDDLDIKTLRVFITDTLVDKISEISLQANQYVLTSKKSDLFKFKDKRPTVDWFIPLQGIESLQRWQEICLKDPTGKLERVLGQSACFAWQLNFATSTPIRVSDDSLSK